MASSKGSTNVRNMSGKHALLPPKSPFPCISSSFADYIPSNVIASKAVQRPREGSTHHQRTSSESLLIDEQPSWLDDLLNEPETPVRRPGHRRSSSDSFAYVDANSARNMDYGVFDEFNHRNMTSISSWASHDFDHLGDPRHSLFYKEANFSKQKNRAWDSSLNPMNNSGARPSVKDNVLVQSSRPLSNQQDPDVVPSVTSENQDTVESGLLDPKSSERKDGFPSKPSAPDADHKRAKQQFAQRSRVRKLQYIAELERNVQALQAEGSEVSAELEFLNQRNLILSMENKALKQRVENLAQEQLIKYLEQEVLEREIGRLRALYQQQQQQQLQPPVSSGHQRSSSRDLDNQFANLSLKNKDATSSRDPVTGALRI